MSLTTVWSRQSSSRDMLSNGCRSMNPPDSRIAHSLGLRGADGNSGLVARRATYTYGADLVSGKLNDSTLTASGATELALIGFAGHLIQQFDIR
jgi:hypothetical protein